MLRKLHIRALCLCMMLIVAMAASAQQPQITERLNRNGQVTVDAPKELVKRNNADLGKQPQSSNSNKKVKEKDKKNVDPKSDEEKLNELDEDTTKDSKKDEDKKKDEEKKKEEVTPKKPKRTHTSQQTIESRGVGFRIQAYTDNNPRTAKAAAQRPEARPRHRHEVPPVQVLHLLQGPSVETPHRRFQDTARGTGRIAAHQERLSQVCT